MKKVTRFAIAALFTLIVFAGNGVCAVKIDTTIRINADTAIWFDATHNRQIPVAVYSTPEQGSRKKIPVLINTGYQVRHLDYGTIAEALAAAGYYVVVIQHDLTGDTPMPTNGSVYENRSTNWERGILSIKYVIEKLKGDKLNLDFKKLVLIGHSNGGDMVMLLAGRERHIAQKVISLDNRRVPLPISKRPAIFSIRSSDQPADGGVLPTPKEQQDFHITIIKSAVKHNDMSGFRNQAAAAEMISDILQCLTMRK